VGLLARRDEIGEGSNVLQTHAGGMTTRSVFGLECGIMLATREGGYHSRPHRHRSEQLNYIAEGSIWVFCEDEAFLARAGDFYRIPAGAVHWGWNRADEPVTAFQAYAPVLDPYNRANAVALLAEAEAGPDEYYETERLEGPEEREYLDREGEMLAAGEERLRGA
jgi:quercetin dioxygenase-like cupin family protein